MNYVITLYGLEDDEFVTEVCHDVSGVKDLSDRLTSIVNYYETLRGSGYEIISVVRMGGVV